MYLSTHSRAIAGAMLVCLLSLQARAQVAPEADLSKVPIKVQVVPRQTTIGNLPGKYVRMVVNLPNQSTELTLSPALVDYKKTLVSWLKKNVVGGQTRSVLIAANASVAGTALPQRAIYYQLHDGGDGVNQYYNVAPLTPFAMASADPIHLEVHAKYTTEVKSNISSSVVAALALGAQLTSSPATLLTDFTKDSFKDAAQKIDKAIDDIFGKSNDAVAAFDFDPAIHERLNIFIPGSPDVLIAAIVPDIRDTLIAPSGKISGFPAARDDITKFTLSDASAAKSVAEMLRALPNVKSPSSSLSPDAIFDFCEAASQSLAKYGLNNVDRAAVLFAYLLDSRWNTDIAYRTAAIPKDACESRVEILADSNLKGLMKTRKELVEHPAPRDDNTDRLFGIRIRDPLDEALRGKDAVRYERFPQIVGETVQIRTNLPVKLGNGALLQPGAGLTVEALDVSDILSAAVLTRVGATAAGNCYGSYVNAGKAGKFRSKSECTNVLLGDGSWSPASIEFTYNTELNYTTLSSTAGLQLVQIRLILPATPAAEAAVASTAGFD